MAVDFTKIAQDLERPPELPITHELWIGGEDRSNKLISSTTTYTTDVGGSGFEFNYLGDLEKHEDDPITFKVGYGDNLVPYFVGKIVSAKDDDESGKATAQGFGPFRLMAESNIGTNESFQGQTINNIAFDLSNRCELTPKNMVVLNGRSYVLPARELFTWDTKCLDVLNTVMEDADFVASDLPGGRRIVMPRPRPGVTKGFVASYDPDSYMELAIDPLHTTTYHDVVVYRNGDNNEPVVFASRVCNDKAPKNRDYVVSDFPGTQQEAEDKAFALAEAMRAGEREFSMTTFFNPELLLWEGFRCIKRKRVDGDWYWYVYNCTIDNSTVLNYAPGEARMEVSGKCYELRNYRTKIEEPTIQRIVSPSIHIGG